MRVLVCGGRYYEDYEYVCETLGELRKQQSITSIVHGCATGVDTLAGRWAWENGIPEEKYPANWKAYGRKAGAMRNLQMIQTKPDLVIAFPGGRGAENVIKTAMNHKTIVRMLSGRS